MFTEMAVALSRDHENTTAMIFGAALIFHEIMVSAGEIEASQRPRPYSHDCLRRRSRARAACRATLSSSRVGCHQTSSIARFDPFRAGHVFTSSSNPTGRHPPQT